MPPNNIYAEQPETKSSLNKFNIFLQADERLFILMAALQAAEVDKNISDSLNNIIRKQILENLQISDSTLIKRIQTFYESHIQKNKEKESSSPLISYLALSFVLKPPPTFLPPPDVKNLPDDVKNILDFSPLLAEFYTKSNIKSLFSKYSVNHFEFSNKIEQTVAAEVLEVLSFLHTSPILEIPKHRRVVKTEDNNSITQKENGLQFSTRRLFIFPEIFGPANKIYFRDDLLNGANTQNDQLGDNYALWVESYTNPPVNSIRIALLQYILQPIVAKAGITIAQRRADILKLADSKNSKDKPEENIFSIVRESLVRAVLARIQKISTVRKLETDLKQRLSLDKISKINTEAISSLEESYKRGAFLVFYFYEQLDVLEKASVDISDLLPQMIENLDIKQEQKRIKEHNFVSKNTDNKTSPIEIIPTKLQEQLTKVDELIRTYQYVEARSNLESILKENPKCARAFFALAQIINQSLSFAEDDNTVDEGDRITAQESRLAQAVELYKKAIEFSTPEETWIASRSHVLIGHIYDFLQMRPAAIESYNQAVKIGNIPGGDYKGAIEGKQHPYKNK